MRGIGVLTLVIGAAKLIMFPFVASYAFQQGAFINSRPSYLRSTSVLSIFVVPTLHVWLIIGGLIFAGFALLWALIDLFRSPLDRGRRIIAFGLLLAAFILGIVDELIHAKDAWASMPDALIISAVVAVLAVAATAVDSFDHHGGRALT